MRSTIIASVLLLAPTVLAAETILLLHDTEDLPPPYSQSWYATMSEYPFGTDPHEVFVRGDGKRGDFFGILQLNCDNPKSSEWVAVGGWLNDPDVVPAKAIRKLRQAAC